MQRLARLFRRMTHLLLLEAVLMAILAFPLQMTTEDITRLLEVFYTDGVRNLISAWGFNPSSFWEYDIESLINTGWDPLNFKEAFAKFLILTALLSWALSHLLRAATPHAGREMRKRNIWVITMVCALVMSFVMGTESGEKMVWLQARNLFGVLTGIAFLFMIGDLVRTRRRAVQWAVLLVVVTAPVILVALLQHIGDQVLDKDRYNWFWILPMPRGIHARNTIGSLIGHNNGVALMVSPGLLLVPWLWQRARSTPMRVLLSLWTLGALWVVVRAQSRSVLLALLVAVVAMFILQRLTGERRAEGPPRRTARWVMIAIVLVLFTQVVPNPLRGSQGLGGRLKRLVDWSDLMSDTRMRVLVCSLPAVGERPIAGWGIGSFAYVYPVFQGRYFNDPENWDSSLVPTVNLTQRAHNDWLQLVMEMGLVGLVLVLWGLWMWGRRGWITLRRGCPPADRALLIALLGMGVLFLVQAGLDFPMHVIPSALVALLAVGLIGNAPEIFGDRPLAEPVEIKSSGERGARIAIAVLLLGWMVWPPGLWFGMPRENRPTQLAPSLSRFVRPIVGDVMANQRQIRAEAHIMEHHRLMQDGVPGRERWLQDALGRLREANQIAPSDPFVRNRLGEVHHHLGFYDPSHFTEAIEHLNAATNEVTHFTAHNYIASSHFELSRLEDSRAFQAQSEGDLDTVRNHRLLAQEHRDLAVQHYEIALDINPIDADSAWNLHVIYSRTGRGQRSVERLKPIAHWRQDWYQANVVEPMFYLMYLGENERALRRIQLLRSIEPDNAVYPASEAECLMRMGEVQMARIAIEAFKRRFPDDTVFGHLEPELALVEGRYEDALTLARSIRDTSWLPQVLALEDIALRALGRNDEADAIEAQLTAELADSGNPPGEVENILANIAWDYLGDRDMAEGYYLKTLENPPGYTTVLLYRLALQAADRGENDRALELLNRQEERHEPSDALRQQIMERQQQ